MTTNASATPAFSLHTYDESTPRAKDFELRLRAWRGATRGIVRDGAYAYDRYAAVVLGSVPPASGEAWPVWPGERPSAQPARVVEQDAPRLARDVIETSGDPSSEWGVDWHRVQRTVRYLVDRAPKRTRLASAPVRITPYKHGIVIESKHGWAIVAACRVGS